MLYFGGQRGVFSSEGLGEMFKGDCRHVRGEISAHVNGGPKEGLACADPGARTPIGVRGFFLLFDLFSMTKCVMVLC